MCIDRVQSQIKEIVESMKDSTINFASHEGRINVNLDAIKSKLNKISEEEKDLVYETYINVKLVNISKYKSNTQKVIKSIANAVEYLELFITSKYEEILYEGTAIGEEFVLKAINYKNRKLHIPIKIDAIKEYSVRCRIKVSNYDLFFIIILLELEIVHDFLKNNINC